MDNVLAGCSGEPGSNPLSFKCFLLSLGFKMVEESHDKLPLLGVSRMQRYKKYYSSENFDGISKEDLKLDCMTQKMQCSVKKVGKSKHCKLCQNFLSGDALTYLIY